MNVKLLLNFDNESREFLGRTLYNKKRANTWDLEHFMRESVLNRLNAMLAVEDHGEVGQQSDA